MSKEKLTDTRMSPSKVTGSGSGSEPSKSSSPVDAHENMVVQSMTFPTDSYDDSSDTMTQYLEEEPAPLGTDDAGSLFANFSTIGNQRLKEIRTKIISPEKRKKARTWSLREASKLIGRSDALIRRDFSDQLNKKPNGNYFLTLNDINMLRDYYDTRYVRPEGSEPMILGVLNFKGGVAKTTSSVHLAQKAAIDGLRVLLVDVDPQASSSFSLGPFIPDLELDQDDVLTNAMMNNPEYIRKIVRTSYFPGIDIIPANLFLQDLELALPNNDINNVRTMGPVILRLKRALDLVKHHYDLIIVDNGPNMGSITLNALTCCNGLVIPVPPSAYDHASFVMLCTSLSGAFYEEKKKLEYLRILITKHSGNKSAIENEAQLRELYGDYVMGSVMAASAEVERSSSSMSSVYDRQPGSKSKSTYTRAIEHMDAVNNEIIDDLKALWSQQAEAAMGHQKEMSDEQVEQA
ncbi:AAA family ATPase [Parendozoicomonas sp. Alg238-R29]|uniref:AAA family ATPase n=1 Tax=Parendozoicomonas sp. Alg238-R29 TaxID=2993446 RepID=UPI00248E00FD|nr:AAA family ATPase [Parendozoicomonas sp. Alg238-R29]